MTITAEVAKVESGPRAMITQYRGDFAAVLPSHIKPATWVRVAQGALKKGKKSGRRYELEIAAENNPATFLAYLLDAARLGLEPGTDEYYLTPRKVKGQLEVLGIVGYQGYIELMYRAGAVSSVVAECVYDADRFEFQPGRDEIPNHQIDWDTEDRGNVRLVYAFARMKAGGFSKVVVLSKSDIKRIKSKAQGASSEYSPWQTDPASMWLKSAVRQLRKWVPTSAEYITTQLRAARAADDPVAQTQPLDLPDVSGMDDDVIEGEIVPDPDPHAADWAALNAEANAEAVPDDAA